MIKLEGKGVGIVSTAAAVVSIAATVIGSWANKKIMDDTIQTKVVEALTKVAEES